MTKLRVERKLGQKISSTHTKHIHENIGHELMKIVCKAKEKRTKSKA